ncbi:hypothetical protein [Membranihabitans maritimus]|uniref:hypothetical protein n=1 Tax=Membranihabitans maritimus TaxID=2904244 RepID=UPI001F2017CD|nr:hypothetical protein [Membranihabitans maritimus]
MDHLISKFNSFQFLMLALIGFSITSCSTTKIEFPISDIAPAADASATIKQDDNNNYEINLTAKYLASPDRLNPPKDAYVVWAKTSQNGVKNLGQLVTKSSSKASLQTVSSFRPVQLFVTAENAADVEWPSRHEIFRTEIFNLD